MSVSPPRFLVTVAGILCVLIAFYYACFSYQIGAHVEAEWWLKDVYSYKDHVAARTESPKIIIVSGSNSLFGINSTIVEDITGVPVVNLAGHAAMDIDFYYMKLREHLGEGDIVVMPLEFTFLQRERVTDWFVNNMLAWGAEDYLSKLNLTGYLKFIVSVPKARLYQGILHQGGANPIKDESEIVAHLGKILETEGSGWRGYNYTSLNKQGDIVSGDKITTGFLKKSKHGFHYYGGWDISDKFIQAFLKIKRLVESRDAKLLLTWSVSMKNKKFDLEVPRYQNNIGRIRDNLRKNSIEIECDPADFHFDRNFFFDTHYHLNKQGAQMRSTNLAECINNVIQIDG